MSSNRISIPVLSLHENFIDDNYKMSQYIECFDWSATALGPINTWPGCIIYAVNSCLRSEFPTVVYLTKDYLTIYNDAYIDLVGLKKPDQILGFPAAQARKDIWPFLSSCLREVEEKKTSIKKEKPMHLIAKDDHLEECYITGSYSPILTPVKDITGAYVTLYNNTYQVINERRLNMLREIAHRTSATQSFEEVSNIIIKSLEKNDADVPFCLLYIIDREQNKAFLQGTVRIPSETEISPAVVDLTEKEAKDIWQLPKRYTDTEPYRVDLTPIKSSLPSGRWRQPPKEAVIIPLIFNGENITYGFLITGISAVHTYDAQHREFLQDLGYHVAMPLEHASHYRKEVERLENLARLSNKFAEINKSLEKEKADREQAQAYRELQDQFTAFVCHELRNPLTGILGNTEQLQKYNGIFESILEWQSTKSGLPNQTYRTFKELLENYKESTDALDKCSQQQKCVVNDVLDLSRLDAGKLELHYSNFDPKSLIDDVLKMIKVIAEKKEITIVTDFSECDAKREQPALIRGDRARITQILYNLLLNSVKFTPEKGKIHLSYDQLKVNEQDFTQKFSVSDTGRGMTDEQTKHVFNRFYQTSPTVSAEHSGSGLGLAISKQLVEAMKGMITVESRIGQGTTISFTVKGIPMVLKPENPTPSLPHSHSMSLTFFPPEKGLKIMIVEDNKINQRVLERILKEQGHDVIIANNGEEAIAKLQTEHDISVIFMDVEMPIMNGLVATQRIREQEAKSVGCTPIPIIGLSGDGAKTQIEKGLQAGMNAYLIKPYEKEKIKQVINQYKKSGTAVSGEQALAKTGEIDITPLHH